MLSVKILRRILWRSPALPIVFRISYLSKIRAGVWTGLSSGGDWGKAQRWWYYSVHSPVGTLGIVSY